MAELSINYQTKIYTNQQTKLLTISWAPPYDFSLRGHIRDRRQGAAMVGIHISGTWGKAEMAREAR